MQEGRDRTQPRRSFTHTQRKESRAHTADEIQPDTVLEGTQERQGHQGLRRDNDSQDNPLRTGVGERGQVHPSGTAGGGEERRRQGTHARRRSR